MEVFVTPLVDCTDRSAFPTVFGWALDGIAPTFIPLPVSMLGERWLLYQAAALGYSALYIAVALWPGVRVALLSIKAANGT